MKLNVLERVVLLGILPKEGSYTNLKLVRKLRESLSFSEEEHSIVNFKEENGRLLWANDVEKDIHVGEIMNTIIVEALKKLDSQNKLNEEQLSLYEKFVGE